MLTGKYKMVITVSLCAVCLVAQSCPILCDPTDCSLPGSCVNGVSPGKNTGVGCHFLLQGTSPTQGLNPGLPDCGQILYCLSLIISIHKNILIMCVYAHMCTHIHIRRKMLS